MAKKKNDNTFIERDGGYEFTAWNFHIVAENVDEAKALAKEYFNVDVDKDEPPVRQVAEDEA